MSSQLTAFATTVTLTSLAFGLVPSSTASAQTAPAASERGIEVSAALGVARSTGKATSADDNAISYNVPALVPFTFGLGYRFAQPLYVGAVLGYAPGFTDHCPSGFDCSVDRFTFGVEARGYLPPAMSATPLWASLGFGYESLDIGLSAGGLSGSGSVDGYQYLSLKLGAEFELARQFVIAPYIGFELAQYDEISQGGRSASIPDDQQSWHTWLSVGARFAYTFLIR
jgi:hypothetical protein